MVHELLPFAGYWSLNLSRFSQRRGLLDHGAKADVYSVQGDFLLQPAHIMQLIFMIIEEASSQDHPFGQVHQGESLLARTKPS